MVTFQPYHRSIVLARLLYRNQTFSAEIAEVPIILFPPLLFLFCSFRDMIFMYVALYKEPRLRYRTISHRYLLLCIILLPNEESGIETNKPRGKYPSRLPFLLSISSPPPSEREWQTNCGVGFVWLRIAEVDPSLFAIFISFFSYPSLSKCQVNNVGCLRDMYWTSNLCRFDKSPLT